MDSKTYWRSLAARAGDPSVAEALEHEFLGERPEELGDDPDGATRRRFLQIMGASFAMAGLAGCRWPKEAIVPFSKNPPGTVPGVPKHYATAMELGGVAHPLVVTSYDGRPIKIEGNPSHPFSQGAATTQAQASVLEIYDPDRSRGVLRKEGSGQAKASWDDFAAYLRGMIDARKAEGGAGFRVLSEATSSPAVQEMRKALLAALPQAKWHEYESLSRDNERLGTRLAFGRPMRVLYDLERASVLACLDADLLGDHPASVKNSKGFSKRRRPGKEMSRIYAVEARYSITGAQADHRLPIRSEQTLPFLLALEAQVTGDASGAPAGGFLAEPKVQKFLAALAKDLAANKGAALVAVGAGQPPEAHAAAARVNQALGAVGKTLSYAADPDGDRPSHFEDVNALAADMNAGAVKALLILGGNPVYNAPADAGFAEALAKVPDAIHLSTYNDETSRACRWHVNRAHYLEAWGDARALDGTYGVVQPLIDPLWGGKSAIEVLAAALGDGPQKGYDIVRRSFQRFAQGSYETSWRRALHDGLVEGTAFPAETPTPGPRPAANVPARAMGAVENGALELVFVQDSKVYDGRFANSAWLQELPDFMTKLTWDNAALVGPATAKALGVTTVSEKGIAYGTAANLTLNGRSLKAAVYVMPGQAPGSVALALGYGRKAAGKVGGFFPEGVETTGFDAGALRASDAPFAAAGLKVEPTSERYALAATQDHFLLDEIGMKGRDERLPQLIREADLEHYEHHPDFAHHAVHHPELVSLWKEHEYPGYKWGMAIDLNACTGCNACVAACQSENNIPVVGKAQVFKNREMHWLRIDRYFKGDPEDPQVAHQPVTCQQCEMAPCEQVCPVAATVHSDEGLNDMVYNRCIGTRYCSNNCPYKVRRFNFFNYQKRIEREPNNDVLRMVFNPEVTVRYRGVMEKCTFCVQRIQNAKIPAKNEGRKVRDGEIVTACQQTCPADAIVFGDLNDPESRVAKLHADSRSYAMLEELNVKPRLHYMAKVRNPNPELA